MPGKARLDVWSLIKHSSVECRMSPDSGVGNHVSPLVAVT
jgi:hypothetical protein